MGEKLRAATAGIPGFYTATGIGSMVENGGIPIKYRKGGGKPEMVSIPKDVRSVTNNDYLDEGL